MVEIRQLKHFIAVVEAEGIRPAAQLVHLSPSSILRSMQQIEEQYGVPLFNKSAKGFQVTQFGEHLLKEARALVAGFDQIAPKLAQIEDLASGSLRVGLAPGVADLLMSQVASRLISGSPGFEISVEISTADILVDRLELQELDLIVAFENRFIGRDNMKVVQIYEINPGWWVRKGHPLLQRKRPKMEEVANYPLLAQHLELLYLNRLDEILRTAGLSRSRKISFSQCNNYRLLFETTLQTDAILLAPQLNCYDGKHTADLRRLRLPIDLPQGWFSAALPQMPTPSSAALHFVEVMKEEVAKIKGKKEGLLD